MIENIIFDFGGVLLDIDYSQTDIHLGGLIDKDRIYIAPFKSIFEEYEIGLFNEEAFLHKMKEVIGKEGITNEAILSGWNSMLGPTYQHRLEMLDRLKSEFRIFLLSNTNTTHLTFVKDHLASDHGIEDFDTRYFEKVYYSHLIQRRKPDILTYSYVLNDAGIEGSSTLFIDDSIENVEGAIAAGIRGIHHDRKIDITSVIDDYIFKAKSL